MRATLPAPPFAAAGRPAIPYRSTPSSRGRRLARLALRTVVGGLLLFLLTLPSVQDTRARLRQVAAPFSFRLLDWETTHVAQRLGRIASGLARTSTPLEPDADVVRRYLGSTGAERSAVRLPAEASIEDAVERAYRRAGAFQGPALLADRLFPPVLFVLTPPASVLVVSPREALRVEASILLRPGLLEASQESLERSADRLGVSSLVAPIGGIATYPAMVVDSSDPDWVASSVAHEWVHQYLVFHPLGSAYFTSQEAREINETVADMVGREIGAEVVHDLSLRESRVVTPAPSNRDANQRAFDSRAFLRETRLEVERLLAVGEIDAAEAYMRDRRDVLAANGMNIRKLNQAYFAFYGSYGDGAAASPRNPVPGHLRRVRERSASVGDFLLRVRDVTTRAALAVLADQP